MGKTATIEIYSCKFKCTCGHEFRATYTDNYKTFVPRKCEECGRINIEGIIVVKDKK